MKSFKQFINEDGMGGGAIAAGPTNVVGSGAIRSEEHTSELQSH